ncbi:filamentous hemagglutinin N-terminal domain-containing protein [Fortiea contorta]|uniref:two-partner secretion domain-containing protein n=1 Tax=Fortiea contorta TaxID=1892405 RepID=UPI000349FA2F|nr:filamentous hemagglutinin N-terminal domain-containing protein [Fortiea contorta]
MKTTHWLSCWQIGLLTFTAINGFTYQTLAQSAPSNIQPDATLGAESSRILQNFQGLPVEVITGGATRGINLFHSLREFNVSEGRGAYFFSPSADIQNILARVTGTNRSEILGTLGTFGESQPNLFLINPNGILFGQNASLDVEGSFIGTTANGVKFENQGEFSATNPEAVPLLTINPSALFMNRINQSATITNQSQAFAGSNPSGGDSYGLRVPDGQSLLLVGGNILMDGGALRAYSGRVELGGLASPGTVNLLSDGNNLSLGFPENSAFSDVFLTNEASIRVEGSVGGSITINARNLDVLQGSMLSAGIGFGLGTVDSQSGDITLNAAEKIQVGQSSKIQNAVAPFATGKSGNINITTGSLSFTDGANLFTSSFGQGNAGDVTVRARDSVSLTGTNTGISSTLESGSVGKGGNININASSLLITDSAELQTLVRRALQTQPAARGDAGNVNIKVTGAVDIAGGGIFSNLEPGTVGSGGNITIDSGSFSLRNDATLSASTFGQGNAGNVTISAKNAVSLVGGDIFSTMEAGGVGKGGNININAASLSLTDGAQLLTGTRDASATQPAGQGNAGDVNITVTGAVDISGTRGIFPSGIRSDVETGTVGNGGNIVIDSGSFSLKDGAALTTSTTGRGNAGNINIKAGQISLLNASGIYASTDGEGNGGTVNVNTNKLTIQNGSFILTDTLSNSTGRGGNITVNSTESIEIAGVSEDNNSSGLYAQTRGAGRAGDIQVTTKRLTVRDGGTISGETSSSGKAGDLTIDASELVEVIGGAPNNLFSSGIDVEVEENASGDAGNLTINTKHLVLRDGAFIAADTRENSRGNGGQLLINATDSVELIGRTADGENPTAISVDVINGGTGNAGNLTINTQRLVIQDGAQVTAKNFGSGQPGQIIINAGESVEVIGGKDTLTLINAVAGPDATGKPADIRINTKRLLLQDGGQIAALTFGKIDGGNIQINATDSIEISSQVFDSDSFLFPQSGILVLSAPFTDGLSSRGGDIKIQTGNLNIRNNGQISATAIGIAGDIDITAAKVTLDNGGEISAESASGNGGNINLNVSDLLLLRRGAQISTTAGTAQAGGDGGNININAKFIVAIPKENSDITANAFTGNGGNINITSRGIFGIEPRPRLTEQSDITASSEFGLAGNINIVSPDNSSIINAFALRPDYLIDTDALLARSCVVRAHKIYRDTFYILGGGALRYTPGSVIPSTYPTNDIRNVADDNHRAWKKGDPIIEPTGVYQLADGRLVLSRECH